ncbi:hypothetical protein SDC9_49251 [bioreactor metagenome]|uniref:Uncharacterized protein n=1 Tax=bioreactor metagenome TaxID=1076179 RepID=A0A644WGU5_9ZZZZ
MSWVYGIFLQNWQQFCIFYHTAAHCTIPKFYKYSYHPHLHNQASSSPYGIGAKSRIIQAPLRGACIIHKEVCAIEDRPGSTLLLIYATPRRFVHISAVNRTPGLVYTNKMHLQAKASTDPITFCNRIDTVSELD